MHVSVVPLSADHLDSVAALLAARHRRDRSWVPDLSPEYEDPAATRPILHDILATDSTCGVVALREGQVVAYLLGAPELRSPTRTFAGFMHPRAAEIPYAGYAATPDVGATVYPLLYATLAQDWVMNGLVGHYITIPANPDAGEPWWDLGFGRVIALSVRATTPDVQETAAATAIEFRRATTADEESVQSVMTEFFRTFAAPPIFVPFLPETTEERRRFVTEYLADPACPYWLAVANGRVVGLQLLEEPRSPHWQQSRLETLPRAVYLFIAYTVPEARGAGIGAALLHHTLAWAREAGYDYCMAHYHTASRASRFWRSLGFQPVSYWLSRSVDERATWTTGRS